MLIQAWNKTTEFLDILYLWAFDISCSVELSMKLFYTSGLGFGCRRITKTLAGHSAKKQEGLSWTLYFNGIYLQITITVKILKTGTPEIITIIVLQLERLDFTVQYCVQKMQTE